MKPHRFGLVLLLINFPLTAQTEQADPLSYIGMPLPQLLEMFGPPKAVHAVRGSEVWQDDVVFEYQEGDFYIYKDRVWQVSLKAAYGISLGDSRAAAALIFGNAEDRGNILIWPLPSGGARPTHGAWPAALRINLNPQGLVSAIFVYRSDF